MSPQFRSSGIDLCWNHVHVWIIALNQPDLVIHSLATALSHEEMVRARRFHNSDYGARFIVGRGVLRTLLGAYVNVPPRRLEFMYGSHGKPELASATDRNEIRFNLSHSGAIGVIAVRRGCEVGIDVERVNHTFRAIEFAERYFARPEVAALLALRPSVRADAFFECWTKKEAYVKAIGDGLALPLDSFQVPVGEENTGSRVITTGDSQARTAWTLYEIDAEPGYKCTLVTESVGLIKSRRWESRLMRTNDSQEDWRSGSWSSFETTGPSARASGTVLSTAGLRRAWREASPKRIVQKLLPAQG